MIEFEIDYPHERAGWIDCFLSIDGNRHKLWASDVLPPFIPLLYWLKAIAIQRLPHKFYWDEEGKGAKFEAWPVAPDSPVFRLRVKHDRDEIPWIEREFDRAAVVQAFLPVLREFAAHQKPSRGDWEIRPEDVEDLAQYTRRVPPRTEINAAEPLHFVFSRSQYYELPAQWLRWEMWGMPLINWVLADTDPFWGEWLTLLEKIVTGDLPAEFHWLDRQVNDSNREMVEENLLPESTLERLWSMHVRAEPLPHLHHFRLIVTETDFWYEDFPLLDEVLDRRQVVQAFCEKFEQFLEKDYQVFTEEDGRVFDLRMLPLNKLRKLT